MQPLPPDLLRRAKRGEKGGKKYSKKLRKSPSGGFRGLFVSTVFRFE